MSRFGCEFNSRNSRSESRFCFCSCTWVSLWVLEEKMAWKSREKRNSFLSSHSTCCWRVSAPHSLMCRTWSSSMNTCEGPNRQHLNHTQWHSFIFCVICCWRNPCYVTDSHLFQVGLLWVDLPVLYHPATPVGGHQTLFQAGNTHAHLYKD